MRSPKRKIAVTFIRRLSFELHPQIIFHLTALAFLLILAGCTTQNPNVQQSEAEQKSAAVDRAAASLLAELDRIASDTSPANFANTVRAIEASGDALSRVLVYWCIGVFG